MSGLAYPAIPEVMSDDFNWRYQALPQVRNFDLMKRYVGSRIVPL